MSKTHLLKLNFNDHDYFHIKNIRKIVFHDELGIIESKLFDEFDKTCEHFLVFDGLKIVGSLRILYFGQKIKLERMAILREFRGNDHGKNTILEIIDYYSALGFSQMFLDSIYFAKEFYKKCGFIQEGSKFQRVGITHYRMSLTF